MRKIDIKAPTQEKWWNNWRKKCADETSVLIEKIKGGKVVSIKNLYKSHKHKFLMHPDGPFRRKCAYCERDLSSQHGDVEHFRPKGGATDEADLLISRVVKGVEQKHPGYYWLAYEWSNLLPSCQICNVGSREMSSRGKPGKRNRFPLEDETARDWKPKKKSKEKPLLLNPTVDDPAEHLVFMSNGFIASRSPRGDKTVMIFGLNDYGMPGDRASKYKEWKSRVKDMIRKRLDGNPDQDQELELDRVKAGYGNFTTFALLAINDAFKETEILFQQARAQLEG